MHAFDVLSDPVRRRILELLADGEATAGSVTASIQAEFGISQPAVSQHLRVLRDSGFAVVRPDGARRLYRVSPEPFRDVDLWLDRFRGFWAPPLDALATELKRGRRQSRLAAEADSPGGASPADPSADRATGPATRTDAGAVTTSTPKRAPDRPDSSTGPRRRSGGRPPTKPGGPK